MRRNIICLCLFFMTIFGFGQEKRIIPKGVIVDSVFVSNTNESYAVYLPSKYDSKIQTAIVFIFEPGARGKIGVYPFVIAAETYNYVLICSNNSKNGSKENNLQIANRLFESVFSEFNIDSNQLYISGFSGGARLAGSIAISSRAFQGLISCGASFGGMDKFALQNVTFSYVGLVGNKDMNYSEMIDNKAWLEKMKVKNVLFISNLEHEWPEQKEILRTFDWLELQSYKKNIRKNNDTVTKRIFYSNLKIADSLQKENDLIAAVEEYQRILEINNNSKEGKSVKGIVTSLLKSKEYKIQVENRNKIVDLENKITKIFLEQFYSELKTAKSNDDFKFWERELKKMQKLGYDKETKTMVSRLNYKIRALIYETSQECKLNFENNKVKYCDKLEKVIQKIIVN